MPRLINSSSSFTKTPFFTAAWNKSGTGNLVESEYTVIANQGGFTFGNNGQLYFPIGGTYFISAYGIATDDFDTRVIFNDTDADPFIIDFRQSDYVNGTHHGCGNSSVRSVKIGDFISIYRMSGTMYSGAGTNNPHNQITVAFLGN